MPDNEFQEKVLEKLAAIGQQLETGERVMLDHEARVRALEHDRAETKGRVAVIAAVIAAAFSLLCVWVGRRF